MDTSTLIPARRDAERPLWVRLSLWQVHSRNTAVFYALASALLATGTVLVGLMGSPVFLAGAAFYAAAGWYWAAVRWMDAHDGWARGRLQATTTI